jgi:DNA polymerase III subunit beta
MKIEINSTVFRDALSKVLSIVDKKNTRQILGFSLINVTKGKIEISASDMEVSVKLVIEASTEGSGAYCINSKTLFEILRELPDSTIVIETTKDQNLLQLSCNSISYSILVHNSDDFPHLVFNTSAKPLKIKSNNLLDIINRTSHAISTDETRIHMNGIFLQGFDSKLRAVATDGHRLSIFDSELGTNLNESLHNGVIVPKKGVLELKRIAESFSGVELDLSFDDSYLYASFENVYFLSIRLIAKEYPKYQAVIPSKTTYKVNLDKASLFNAVKRIKIMSNEKSNGVKIHLENSQMTLTANHPSLGEAKEIVSINYTGKPMEIGFNAKYLIDVLSTVDEEDIQLELNNELSPVVLKSLSNPNYLGIIMPLKL